MDELIVTLDTDWAPDFAIDFAAEQLRAHRVCATWLITHHSPAIERLRQDPELFELGIHPNFLPGSTHGGSPDAVLRHCLSIVPEARSLRTHALVQSTELLEQIMRTTPITVDASLFLPHAAGLRPVEHHWAGRMLLRIPYCWEDDFEMERTRPAWHLDELLRDGEGMRVFDFHPIHVWLNSAARGPYETLKTREGALPRLSPEHAEAHVQQGDGTRTMFLEVLGHLASTGRSRCLRDLVGAPSR